MRTVGFFQTLGFQLALTTSLLILAVGALVVWQVDGILRTNEMNRFSENLVRARTQLQIQIDVDRELSVTGSSVLANQSEFREAIVEGDVVAILQLATEFFNRTGAPLQGTPGLQIYDPRGDLIIRVHDPLRGRQETVPLEILEVLRTNTPLGVVRVDEFLGPVIVGLSPVFDSTGELVGVIEALTALDRAYVTGRERLLGVFVALVTPSMSVVSNDSMIIPAGPITDEIRAQAAESDSLLLQFGERRYLSTLMGLTSLDGEQVAHIYLGVDEDDILSSVSEVRQAALRTTALGAALAVALAAGLAVVTVRPINDLVDAARRIQANDLDTPVDTNGPTEVLELADALDDLRLAVRQTREAMVSVNRDLASRADASTASLSEVSQELAVMHGILRALGTDSPLGLAGVADSLLQLNWVDGATIALATQDGRLSVVATGGISAEAARTLFRTVERGVPGQPLESGVIVADTMATPETQSLAALEIGGFAAQPLVEPDGITGIVAVTTHRPLRLTPTRTDLLRSVAREVTLTLERSELAGEVEENRRIAESVLREMTDGVLVIDHQGRCLVANPAAARLIGRSRTELVAETLADILPLSEQAIATLQRRATDGAHTPVTPLLTETNGRRLAISAGPFTDPDPTRTGMMILLHDLSAEAEADRVKQDFVSMVGHELRTPLTLIRATIDLLDEGDAGELNETQAHIVDVLVTNTDRLMVLISDLLDMSTIDSGRMQIQPEPMDLAEVIKSAVADASRAAEAKGHQISVTLGPHLPTISGDRRRIGQVLANLLGNAVKYTPEGGLISVSAALTNHAIHVSVRDNGIGIPPAEQTQLFEKFYRTTSGRRTTGGTGLGLAIARSLVEMHGGRIWVESDGESGSTFVFTLPLRPI